MMKLADYLKFHTSDRGNASVAEHLALNFLERIVVSIVSLIGAQFLLYLKRKFVANHFQITSIWLQNLVNFMICL